MKTKHYEVWCWMGLLAAWFHAPDSPAAVRVYGLASSSGELITAQIYADISTSPIVSHSYKLFYDPRLLQVEDATRNTAVWTLFDGARPVPYQQPDTSHRGEVWFVGAKLDARDPGAGVLGTHVLLGTAVFSRLNALTPELHLTMGRPGDYANFVTSHGIALDPLPGEVIFANVAPPREDQDLDGLDDAWEVRFFGDPKLSFYRILLETAP